MILMNIDLDTKTLTHYFSLLSSKSRANDAFVEIISRETTKDYGTFPAENITCKFRSGKLITLRCKYGGGLNDKTFSHRMGIDYESRIYSDLLNNVPLSTIPFYGFCHITEQNRTLLVLEYLDGCLPVRWHVELDVVEKAAAWIGNLHRIYESNVPAFVKVYDENYFTFWVQRSEKLINGLADKYDWVLHLRDYFLDNIKLLTTAPQTLVHGEFFGRNILVRDGNIYPVDWESAAMAPGEIDLASLIDGRNPNYIKTAIEGYKSARFLVGQNPANEFEQRLLLARLYFYFRWMSEDQTADVEGWTKSKWINIHLQNLAEQAGCI